ncbi:unnamed protein product [Sympodiomycopsis kandeliae]
MTPSKTTNHAGLNGSGSDHSSDTKVHLYKGGFAKRSADVIQLMNNLRGCGASLELDVPTIAIIGNQSSGKSSVIEAISGISLPRASGTCTRCPMEVRLVQEDVDWTCEVALRVQQSSESANLREVPFGDKLRDPSQVCDRLRRAQLAILSINDASASLGTFIDNDINSIPQPPNEFTENTVCVTIHDRKVVNLSFVDMPGIISNVGKDKRPEDIELVRGMAWKAISRDNCLILLTINCCDDIQNQVGATLARKADPEGKRTVGVLTKTDQIAEGDHQSWLDVLNGIKEALQFGYYAVKNPATKELNEGITFEQARAVEKAFFQTAPWSQQPQSTQGRLGIARLSARLSSLLEHFIQERLPQLIGELEQVRADTNNRLALLPDKIESREALAFVAKLCAKFSAQIATVLRGVEIDSGGNLLRDIRMQAIEVFAELINSSEPIFFIDPSKDDNSLQLDKKKAKYYAVSLDAGTQSYVLNPALFGKKQRVVFTIGEVKTMIRNNRTVELPGNTPYRMKTQLMQQALEHMPSLTQQCFKKTQSLLQGVVKKLIHAHFREYKFGGLFSQVEMILATLQKECEQEAQKLLAAVLEAETSFIFTNNETLYLAETEKWLEKYRGHQYNAEQRSPNGRYTISEHQRKMSSVVADLAALGYLVAKTEDLQQMFGQHDGEEELAICAQVQGFWHVASRRIIDILPLLIIVHYVQTFGSKVHDALSTGLALHSEDGVEKCATLIQEQDDVVAQRAALTARMQRLDQGLKKMQDHGAM